MESKIDPTSQDIVRANNLFTSAAYKETSKFNKGNFMVSPLSVEVALAFTQSGCKNETAQEIRSALHLPTDESEIEAGFKSFLSILEGVKRCTFKCANKLYVKEEIEIKEAFKRTAVEIYQSDPENIDFMQKESAAENINRWVQNMTNNKIRNIVSSQDLNQYTRAILINTLYFKSDWLHQFLITATEKADFYKTATDIVQVDTMHYSAFLNRRFSYSHDTKLKVQFLELLFENGDASMTIVLPDDKEGLAALEDQIEEVFAPRQSWMQLVNIAIPKFKVESNIDFKKILQNLGVQQAFDDKKADLSGIAGEKGDLIIDKILQKTFIEINEKGVEAAAGTMTSICVPCSGCLTQPPNFIADHPFIFYIKIKEAIAFVGRVTDPKQ